MKKVLLIGLSLFGAVMLTGCDKLNSLISGEKEYKYDDFKALLADRKLSFSKTKATAVVDTDGDKSTREYTYNSEDEVWECTYQDGSDTVTDYKKLDIVSQIKNYDLTAALLNKKADDIFTFYATNNSYRITFTYEKKHDAVPFRAEGEYKFGADGLQTYSREKIINLDAVTSTETTITYTYTE